MNFFLIKATNKGDTKFFKGYGSRLFIKFII